MSYLNVLGLVAAGFIALVPLRPAPLNAAEPVVGAPEAEARAVLAQCRKVAAWQLTDFGGQAEGDWVNATAFIGFAELYHSWHDAEYEAAIVALGRRNHWDYVKVRKRRNLRYIVDLILNRPDDYDPARAPIDLEIGRPYHADDHAHGQYAIELYWHLRDPAMIRRIRQRIDFVIGHPRSTPLTFGNPDHQERWNWSDALFMAPPVYIRLALLTGDDKYLDFLDHEFKATTDHLWSKDHNLIFRDDRFIQAKNISSNGMPVFWGRGNGWVYAGLARILELYPEDRPSRRMYLDYFLKMTEAVIASRQDDALWTTSLLDSDEFKDPETSASYLFVYGLAWGSNHGLLESGTYSPVVLESWHALQRFVQENGRVTGVQPPDSEPRAFDPQSSRPYGTGAFLLACSQVYQMLGGKRIDKRALSEAARLK